MFFFFSSRRRHTRCSRDWSSDVCSSDLSFGHMTEYLAAQATVAAVHTFDADPAFIGMTRLKVSELGLERGRDVALFTNEETCNLPYASGGFDLVGASGVVEHLPLRTRPRQGGE